MILESAERQRFIEYCKQVSNDSGLIANQLKGLNQPHYALIIKHEEEKALAYKIVYEDLSRVEEWKVSR